MVIETIENTLEHYVDKIKILYQRESFWAFKLAALQPAGLNQLLFLMSAPLNLALFLTPDMSMLE